MPNKTKADLVTRSGYPRWSCNAPDITMMDNGEFIDYLLQLPPLSEKAIDEILKETRIPTREGFDSAEFRCGIETIRRWAKLTSNLPGGSKLKTHAKKIYSAAQKLRDYLGPEFDQISWHMVFESGIDKKRFVSDLDQLMAVSKPYEEMDVNPRRWAESFEKLFGSPPSGLSQLEYLIVLNIKELFENHFAPRRAGVSRSASGKNVGGPFVRFTLAILNGLRIWHHKVTPETVARALGHAKKAQNLEKEAASIRFPNSRTK